MVDWYQPNLSLSLLCTFQYAQFYTSVYTHTHTHGKWGVLLLFSSSYKVADGQVCTWALSKTQEPIQTFLVNLHFMLMLLKHLWCRQTAAVKKKEKKKAGRFNRCVLISDGRERDNNEQHLARQTRRKTFFITQLLPPRRRFYFCVWVPSVHFLRDKEFLLFLFSWWWCCAVTQQQNYTHIFCVNKHHTLNPNGPSNERAAVSPPIIDRQQKNIRDAIPWIHCTGYIISDAQ